MIKRFNRRDRAERMTCSILSPYVLDDGLRSSLFRLGMRRIGKAAFPFSELWLGRRGLPQGHGH